MIESFSAVEQILLRLALLVLLVIGLAKVIFREVRTFRSDMEEKRETENHNMKVQQTPQPPDSSAKR